MDLSPQQRIYVRKRTAHQDPDPSELMGELNIVPYLDIVVNIIIFLLATINYVLTVAQLDAHLPTLGAHRVGNNPTERQLNLSVIVTRRGLIVGAERGFLAPGCQNVVQSGTIAVPAQGGRLVWQVEAARGRREPGPTARTLTACARRIKHQFPDETQVILSADPEIEFEHVIGAMDALRADGSDELFPDVLLSAGQR